MADHADETVSCRIVKERHTVSLGQLCRSCGVDAEWVALLVEYGVIDPDGSGRAEPWQFRAVDLRRVHIALHLQRDLSLNVPGIALALDLMEKIDDLGRRLEASDHH